MALDRLDWDKLKVFRIVSESGSISAAARRLGESPPTVSRKIDELEKALNASLFTRSTRGIEMTDAGKKALIHAEAMAEAASALKNEVADIDMPAKGAVTLVCGDGLGAHWIAPHLPEFQRAHPGIRLQIRITDAIPDPIASDGDITVQFSEPRRQDLISRKLGTLHYMCFSSRAYLDLYGQPSSVFDFHSHRVIFHDGYVNQVEKWPRKTADLTKVIDYALVTNSGAVMMAVCAGGGGIAVLPSYVAALDDRLVPLELPEVVPAAFWITYSERMRRLQRGQVVIEWLRTMFDQRKHVWFRNTFHHPNSLTEE
ncbi:MAG: LysR family transcriptional regulator [Pseudomonadota bacterium]